MNEILHGAFSLNQRRVCPNKRRLPFDIRSIMEKREANRFFATAAPLRLFFIVALPGLISMLAVALYNVAEGSFVGKIIGEDAFAAINLAVPMVMINFALSDLIGFGSSVPIAVALGQKNEKEANNIFTTSVIMIFICGIISGLVMYFTAPLFVSLMNAEGELAALAVRYVRVYAIFSPVTTLVFATDNYLRISGFVKGSMLLNIFMTIMTVSFLFLYLVVFKMGAEGAALASCTSLFISALIALIPFVSGKAILKFTKPKPTLGMIGKITACGMPIFLNNIAGRITAIIMNTVLLAMGGPIAVSTLAVLMYAAGIIEPMLYGMSDSVQPAVGYNWGAGSLSRVRDITKCSFIVCGIVSILCTAVMVIFPGAIASIFVDAEKSPELMREAVHAMRIFGTSFIIGWFGFAVQGFFGAIEKPMFATILSFCRALIFPVILIFALSFMGLDGLWFNFSATSLLTAILAVIMVVIVQRRMKRDITKYIPVVEKEASDGEC